MKILNPMLDFVFKALFGSENLTSKKLLIALLNDILMDKNQDPIEDVFHLNPFNYKEFEEDKLSVLDIKAKTNKGEIINIEVQVKNEDSYRKRSLYYWSKTYAESIQESESYESLKKTIAINIMGYNTITESNKLHTIFKVMEIEENFILIDDLQIHYLELPKLPEKEVEELEGIELWLDFLKEAGKEGSEERLGKLKERSEAMETVINQLEEISADERMREIYRAREKSRLDMISKLKYAENKGVEKGMEEGKKEGKKEGREEGRKEGKEEIVRNLLLSGLDVDLVVKYTKLSKEEVEKIKKRISVE